MGTTASGVVAYDLPNTASAVVQWGTGRGNFKRTGTSPVPVPLISAADASIAEGNSGQASLKIPVTLSLPTSVPVSVSYTTADGTATAGSDYVAAAGTLTIPPGSTTGEVTVTVNADRIFETNETLLVNLASPTNGVLTDTQAVGTITNDDAAGLSISDVSVAEPPAGTRTATFTVTLAPTAAGTATVQYATRQRHRHESGRLRRGRGNAHFRSRRGDPDDTGDDQRGRDQGEPGDLHGHPVEPHRRSRGRVSHGHRPDLRSRQPLHRDALPPRRHPRSRRPGAQPWSRPRVRGLRALWRARDGTCRVAQRDRDRGRPRPATCASTRPAPALPFASTINYSANQTRANNAFVPLGASGQLAIRLDQAAGSVHVILDVNGYVE